MVGIFKGSTEIGPGKIQIGGTVVKEVYVGSTKVWPINVEPGLAGYTLAGQHVWTCPEGVTSVDVCCVGSGGGGGGSFLDGGGGGSLGYRNNIAVTPGAQYTLQVGTSIPRSTANPIVDSWFINTSTVMGRGAYDEFARGFVGDGGGNGGQGGGGNPSQGWAGAGAGAAGYSGTGGNGADGSQFPGSGSNPTVGSGGGGGGGTGFYPGGGVGALGLGPDGQGSVQAGTPGSYGVDNIFGGGGDGQVFTGGASGAVAIRWNYPLPFPQYYPAP